MRIHHTRAIAFVVGLVIAADACAQQSTTRPAPAATPSPRAPQVGAMAPDFALPGVTRYGQLDAPVRLSDFRGKTVVLAFFFQARTRG